MIDPDCVFCDSVVKKDFRHMDTHDPQPLNFILLAVDSSGVDAFCMWRR